MAARSYNYHDEDAPDPDQSDPPPRQVFHVLPVESILGKMPELVVPIGHTIGLVGTIPFAMRQNAMDLVDAVFDTKRDQETRDGTGAGGARKKGERRRPAAAAGPKDNHPRHLDSDIRPLRTGPGRAGPGPSGQPYLDKSSPPAGLHSR